MNIDTLEKYMRIALNAANEGSGYGESPFGACILINNETIVSSSNKTMSERIPISHAEMKVLQELKQMDITKINSLVLFSTCEPCIMCFWAAYLCGVREFTWGISINDAIALDSGDIPISIMDINAKYNLGLVINAGICKEACLNLMVNHKKRLGHL
ncbi:MAG: hypothetical protein K2L70_00820 [Clostridia bacterium]|nr:hypothetical protein [Clostridia bacterium]